MTFPIYKDHLYWGLEIPYDRTTFTGMAGNSPYNISTKTLILILYIVINKTLYACFQEC